MDQRAIDALVEAGLNNRRQVFGLLYRDKGACAMGVIREAAIKKGSLEEGSPMRQCRWVSHAAPEVSCPYCGRCYTEIGLILHCNDDHRWDFLTIARKLEHLVALPTEWVECPTRAERSDPIRDSVDLTPASACVVHDE